MADDDVERDFEICRKCRFFHEENDPIEGRGWHWGVGSRCAAVAFGSPWSQESAHASPEEEFVRAHILFIPGRNSCCQNKD